MEGCSVSSEESSVTPNLSYSLSLESTPSISLISILLEEGIPPFRVEMGRQTERQSLSCQQQQIREKILSYNRKEKSLEELSRKFIDNFEGREGKVLELDKVTVQLQVERRRIYDIVNIFESLGVVRKASKNNYVWRGLILAVDTISRLKQQGPNQPTISHKKEKSLQNLAGRFLHLFIFAREAISLEEAAKVLIQTKEAALAKTKIRRLYDIVNVFKSIGLVRKVHVAGKKSGFEWLGTPQLQVLIKEKKQLCIEDPQDNVPAYIQPTRSAPEIELKKENNPVIQNKRVVMPQVKWEEVGRMSGWTSLRRQFQDSENRYFNPQFSQKTFFPAILSQSSIVSLESS